RVREDRAVLDELGTGDRAERGLLRPVLVEERDLRPVLQRLDLVRDHVPAEAERLAGAAEVLDRLGGEAGADVDVLHYLDALPGAREERLERVVRLARVVRRVE